jgi:hypothetical protein
VDVPFSDAATQQESSRAVDKKNERIAPALVMEKQV